MSTVFLHGGGDRAEWRGATFGRFAAACAAEAGPLALVVCEASEAESMASFAAYPSSSYCRRTTGK